MRVPYSTTCLALLALVGILVSGQAQDLPKLYVPYLAQPPVIDGQLAEWKDDAFSDGVWDIYRLRHASWYDGGRRNRLTGHGNEPHPEDDLRARYYIAWDDDNLYLGAEVHDNVNDVSDPAHADRRWMFKDAICWFIEALRNDAPGWFGQGNNAFCFVIDGARPSHGTWWRHGAPGQTYLEELIPAEAVDYALRFDPWGTGSADFILEARVEMAARFPRAIPAGALPRRATSTA